MYTRRGIFLFEIIAFKLVFLHLFIYLQIESNKYLIWKFLAFIAALHGAYFLFKLGRISPIPSLLFNITLSLSSPDSSPPLFLHISCTSGRFSHRRIFERSPYEYFNIMTNGKWPKKHYYHFPLNVFNIDANSLLLQYQYLDSSISFYFIIHTNTYAKI